MYMYVLIAAPEIYLVEKGDMREGRIYFHVRGFPMATSSWEHNGELFNASDMSTYTTYGVFYGPIQPLPNRPNLYQVSVCVCGGGGGAIITIRDHENPSVDILFEINPLTAGPEYILFFVFLSTTSCTSY